MIKFFRISIVCLAPVITLGCSQVLETVNLKITTNDNAIQEQFNVIEKTLTLKEAKKQNNAPYIRKVLQDGRGTNARSISERMALRSKFPQNATLLPYRIGIGDTLTFSRLVENNRLPSDVEIQLPKQQFMTKYKLGIGDTLALTLIKEETVTQATPINRANDDNSSPGNQNAVINSQSTDTVINSKGRIGSDGSVLLLEVGRLETNGKTLNELRSEVRNILIRNGVSPRFQLEIVEFKSQKAYLTVNKNSKVIKLDDQRTTLRDILTSAEVGFQPATITRVKLQRDNNEFIMSLRSIFSQNAPKIYISDRDHIFVEDSSASIASTKSTVDYQGYVVFEGVGKVKAAGLSLSEIRNEIEALIQQLPDSQNTFQIQITDFASQKALLNIPESPGGVITLTDNPLALDEVLTEKGLTFNGQKITRINLQRHGISYYFTLDDLLKQSGQRIYLQNGDRVKVETLSYKENKVFILGGVDAQIFTINPANRETLADVLFASGGPLKASSAKRSEVYLLRGSSPVVAYHLDAQSPTRLIVADALELRPNDILYVAEQPIISFNRTLATIIPLRILLRDIQDENIP